MMALKKVNKWLNNITLQMFKEKERTLGHRDQHKLNIKELRDKKLT